MFDRSAAVLTPADDAEGGRDTLIASVEDLMGKLRERAQVATVKGVDGSLDDLHVLLRHRLLRQPRSVEGLLWVPERLEMNDLALAQRVDVGKRRLKLDACMPRLRADTMDRD